LDGIFEFYGWERFVGSASEGELAHLSFDAAYVASGAAFGKAFLKDFVEHGVMEGVPVPRGEWRRNAGVFGG
jgi:hypothetical protein